MRIRLVFRESWAMVTASKVSSLLVTFLVLAMCTATLLTVGRTAATEVQVQERLESAGSRLLVITDLTTDKQYISPTVVDSVNGFSTVERSFGVRSTVDVVNGALGAGGTKVPAWGITGDIGDAAILVNGRMPGPGEALASATAMENLGLDGAAGWVRLDSEAGLLDLNIVGSFESRTPFNDYEAGILYVPLTDGPSSTLQVILADSEVAQATQTAVLGVMDADPGDIKVQSPIGAAELQSQVMGDVAVFGRALLLGVLGGGAVLVATVTLADVLVRRADLGRRRALGATRSTIIALVVLRTAYTALIGAVLGIIIGRAITGQMGAVPPTSFSIGVGMLSLIAALLSALPPAIYAASRDPVGVLRTP
ncbi:MAG: ABC transporter permease [Ancrocorticia sp.]|uniref:ABC transporter permease n=1 Tax=Ancrocorticia sp. TaxID=2593684 RepID=UPI003F8F4410